MTDELELDFIARNLTPVERSCALPRCLRCCYMDIYPFLEATYETRIEARCRCSHWIVGQDEHDDLDLADLCCAIADNLTCNDFAERD